MTPLLRLISAPLALLLALALVAAPACNEDDSNPSVDGDTDTADNTDTNDPDPADADPDGDEDTVPVDGDEDTATEEEAEADPDDPRVQAREAMLRCGDDFELAVPLNDACYPDAAYGVQYGDVIRNLEWEDCDGNPVNFGQYVGHAKLIMLTESAGWCSVCREEVTRLGTLYETYRDQGFVILQTLFQNNSGARSTRAFCRSWRDEYSLTFPVLNDPERLTLPYHPDRSQPATPLNVLLDRDMRIQYIVEGLYPQNLEPQVRRLLGLPEE